MWRSGTPWSAQVARQMQEGPCFRSIPAREHEQIASAVARIVDIAALFQSFERKVGRTSFCTPPPGVPGDKAACHELNMLSARGR